MLEAIDKEVDVAQTPEHEDYGMFVLVLMSHGGKNNCIFGFDGTAIELSDVYYLLTPQNFPTMSGKPKLIIVQACAGGRNNYQRLFVDLWICDMTNQQMQKAVNYLLCSEFMTTIIIF